MTSGPAADAAVRPAAASDVEAIGAVHARAWTASYADVLPEDLASELDPRVLAQAWRPAVTAPPSARHRVLVATATDLVTAFAALAPAEDPDAAPHDVEVVAFEVDPAHRGAGHGSRLLNAVADTARELGYRRLIVWSPQVDDPRLAFLCGSGAAPDGARRVRTAQAHDPAAPDDPDDHDGRAGHDGHEGHDGRDGRDGQGSADRPDGGWAEVRLVADLTPEPTAQPAPAP